MESPGLIWIPTGVARPTCATWSPTRRPTSGSTGSSATTRRAQPFADEAAADFVARYVLGLRRASRCPTATLDRSIYQYSATCYYETIYIQGGNLLDDARRRMGSTAFWAALRGYIAAHRYGIADDDVAARRARRGDAARPRARRCSRRASRRSTEPAVPQSAGPRRSACGICAERRAAGAGARPASPRRARPRPRRSRGPHGRPYSARTSGGSSPTDGHSVQS